MIRPDRGIAQDPGFADSKRLKTADLHNPLLHVVPYITRCAHTFDRRPDASRQFCLFAAKNPPPACLAVPMPYVPSMDVCLKMFDVYTPGRKLHACVNFLTRIEHAEVLVLEFDCFVIGRDGVSHEKYNATSSAATSTVGQPGSAGAGTDARVGRRRVAISVFPSRARKSRSARVDQLGPTRLRGGSAGDGRDDNRDGIYSAGRS